MIANHKEMQFMVLRGAGIDDDNIEVFFNALTANEHSKISCIELSDMIFTEKGV